MDHAGAGPRLTRADLEHYLSALSEKGRTASTLQTYRRSLELFYRHLPPGRSVSPGMLPAWQAQLLSAGYRPNTINTCLSVAANFLEFLGCRDLAVPDQLPLPALDQPSLTRQEYLRLLQTARALGKERAYLLIKLFALTGLPVQAVEDVTAETAAAGRIPVTTGSGKRMVRIPPCLGEELRHYAARQGIRSGPLFITREGKPLGRTNISDAIRHLCGDARVPETKGNPRCLRKLYLETQAAIEDRLALLAEQAYDHMLEQEQLAIGWEGA